MKTKKANPHQVDAVVMPSSFPNPICMECGKGCNTWEIVETETFPSDWEMWCYCKKCKVETFHELPPEYHET